MVTIEILSSMVKKQHHNNYVVQTTQVYIHSIIAQSSQKEDQLQLPYSRLAENSRRGKSKIILKVLNFEEYSEALVGCK